MKLAGFFFSIIVALIVHSQVSLWGVAPNFTVVVAYTAGIYSGPSKGILLGSVVGILEDSVSGNILGPNLLGKGIAGFLASFSSGSLFRWTPLLGMLSLFTLTVMDGAIVFLSRTIFESAPSPPSGVVVAVLMQAILNAIIGMFIRPRNVD